MKRGEEENANQMIPVLKRIKGEMKKKPLVVTVGANLHGSHLGIDGWGGGLFLARCLLIAAL